MMSAYFMDIEIPEQPPIVNSHAFVKEIWSGKKWYSCIRKNYQRAVFVLWENDEVTIEPVCNLIDFVNMEICEEMIPVLYDWKVSVESNLCKTKLCAFCLNKRNEDDFLCSVCEESTYWLKSFLNNEKIHRENIHRENKYITGKRFNRDCISPHPVCLDIPLNLMRKRKHCELDENINKIETLLKDTYI
mgnify:CR=1 FL=1|jgi:hypothetical protein